MQTRYCGRACASALIILVGCSGRTNSNLAAASTINLAKSKVVAQGQILPASGFIQLSAPPGDVVEKLLVAVGDSVVQGQPLLRMRSEDVSQAKLKTLRKRKDEAIRERSNTIAQAALKVAATELALERLQAQQISLTRRKALLELARQQVSAAEQVLKKLESISRDAITSEFVGQMEIDRQRISVGEATLNFRQQSEAQSQAQEELMWAQKAAQEEKTAAMAMLSAAEASEALEILDLEIKALETQAAAARILAPSDGVVLAINATEGEASIQLPLIEMANLDRMVCEIEINEADAALVKAGQAVGIASRAFGERKLMGQIARKFKLVGRPQLRPLDPLARTDFRTVTAVVELEAESVEVAQDWLQLQVEVEIDTQSQIP